MATYYVKNGGDDAKDGLSDGNAWATYTHAVATAAAGSTILGNGGDVFREVVTAGANNCTFGAYGTGKPVINGSTLGTSWTSEVTAAGENFLDGSGSKPISWWMFEEAAGATALDGNTTNANDLTDHGTVARDTSLFKQGIQSADTNGSTQYFTRADASLSAGFPAKVGSTAASWTIGGWVYFDALGVGNTLWGKVDDTVNKGIILRLDSGGTNKFSCKTTVGGTSKTATGNSALSTSTWYHVIARYTLATDLALFVNNVKQTDNPAVGTYDIPTSAQALSLGARSYTTVDKFHDGRMDEWFVFTEALSDGQISDLYTTGLAGSAGTTYYYKTGFSQPHAVYENGTAMIPVANKVDLAVGSWWWDNPNSRVYIRCTGDADPATKTIEVVQRNGIDLNAKTGTTIDGLSFTKFYPDGILITGASTTVQNCLFDTWECDDTAALAGSGNGVMILASNTTLQHNVYSNGVWGIASYTSGSVVDNTLIQYELVYNMQGNGINPNAAADTFTNCITQYCTTYQCALRAAIGPSYGIAYGDYAAGTGNIVRYNVSYNNGNVGSQGMGFGAEGSHRSGVIFHHNLTYGNYGASYFVVAGSGDKFYHNVGYHSANLGFATGEIQVDSGAANLTFNNNILYATTGGLVVNFITGSTTGHTLDYNCFYGGEATPFRWAGTKYNFANYKTATSQDANSINADPLFGDATAGDFHLQRVSPCVNAGVVIAGINDGYYGTAPDIGAYETEGAVPLALRHRRRAVSGQ